MKYNPGLVGGHCIGVDPYYLAQKAQELGYHPEITLAGRRINDSMGEYVATQIIKLMVNKGLQVKGSKALILGVTFKENCPDIRNSKVVDIYTELKQFGLEVDVYDPHVNAQEVLHEYGIPMTPVLGKYDSIVLAVAHDELLKLDFENLKNSADTVIYDIKSVLDREMIDARL
jgi:UDP-N-acetyl-D-galactosamine dehydrogenase